MSDFSLPTFLSHPQNLPVIAILAGCAVGAVSVFCTMVVKVVKIVVAHRERMAKIEQGIDPDYRFRADASSHDASSPG